MGIESKGINMDIDGAFNRVRYVMDKCKSYLVTIDGDSYQEFYIVENQPQSWFKQEGIYVRSMTKENVFIYVDGLRGYKEWLSFDATKDEEDFIKLFDASHDMLVEEGDSLSCKGISIELVSLPKIDIKKSIQSGEWNRHDCLSIWVNGEPVTRDGELYRSKRGLVEVHTMTPFFHIGFALTTLLQKAYQDASITISTNTMTKKNDCDESYTILSVSITSKSIDTIEDILEKYFALSNVKGKVDKLEEVTVDGEKSVKVVVHMYDCYQDMDYPYES